MINSSSAEKSGSKNRKRFPTWSSLGSVLLLSAPIWLLRLAIDLHYDNTVYQAMALDFYRYGKLPYLGSWDSNFPGIVFIHLIAITLFGESDMGLKCFDVLIQVGFMVVFYRLLLRWLSEQTSAIAVLLYVLYYVDGCPGLSAQRDVYGTIATITAYYLLTKDYPGHWKDRVAFISAGLLIGLSIAIRPTSVAFIPLFCGYLISIKGIRHLNGWISALLLGMLMIIPMGCFLLWYYFIPHGLAAFYESTIRFNLDVYTKIKFGMQEAATELFNPMLLFPLGLFGLSLATVYPNLLKGIVRRQPQIQDRVLFILSLFSSAAIIMIQQKYFRYHFATFFTLLIPFAALAIEYLVMLARPRRRNRLLIALLLVTSTLWIQIPLVAGHMIRSFHRKDPIQTIAAYLNRAGNQPKEIEICSLAPNLRRQLKYPCAGPYIIFQSLGFRTIPDSIGPQFYTDYQQRWKREYVETLRTHRPDFILIDRLSYLQYLSDIYLSTLRYVPGFDSLLQTSYRYDTTIFWVNIYRRK